MSRCCVECFADPYLREEIDGIGERGDCHYCKRTTVVCADVEAVGDLIREGLGRAYREADDEAGPYDSEDDAYIWMDPREAPTLLEVLRDDEETFALDLGDATELLLADLLDASAPRPHRMKDLLEPDPFGDPQTRLFLTNAFFGAQDSRFDSSWEAFKFQVQHVARFFDGSALGAPREELLDRVHKQLQKLELSLPAGTHLFRARIAPKNASLPSAPIEQARELGPAPVRKSKAGRMNPPGISYTYLSMEPETALAELRSTGIDTCWVGEFVTKIPLTIVDLSFTNGMKPLSIFDPGYDHEHRLLLPSLRAFAREISQEINESDEALDYIPTQVLTEFLRSKGACGVQYSSARKDKGMNLTLFCGRSLEEDGVLPHLDPGTPKHWGKGFTRFDEWLDCLRVSEYRKAWQPIS